MFCLTSLISLKSNVGDVYIADTSNNRIRKVTVSTGIITTIAGTGIGGSTGDNGAATSALVQTPTDIALDSSGTEQVIPVNKGFAIIFFAVIGNVYIADTVNSRIRKVTVSTGIIYTIAGTGTSSYSGDNDQATSAALSYPFGVALDASG